MRDKKTKPNRKPRNFSDGEWYSDYYSREEYEEIRKIVRKKSYFNGEEELTKVGLLFTGKNGRILPRLSDSLGRIKKKEQVLDTKNMPRLEADYLAKRAVETFGDIEHGHKLRDTKDFLGVSRKKVEGNLKKYLSGLQSEDGDRIRYDFLMLLFGLFYSTPKHALGYIRDEYYKRTGKKITDEKLVDNLNNILGKDLSRRKALEQLRKEETKRGTDIEKINFPNLHNDLINLAEQFVKGRKQLDDIAWFVYEFMLCVHLYDERKKVFGWLKWASECRKKKFHKGTVNAPMGLGKTYAIAEVIAKDTGKVVKEAFVKKLVSYGIEGLLEKKDLAKLTNDPGKLFAHLAEKGYISDEGALQWAFMCLKDKAEMELPAEYGSKRADIYDLRQQVYYFPANELWDILVKNGYIDTQGVIQDKFYSLTFEHVEEMDIGELYRNAKKAIYMTMLEFYDTPCVIFMPTKELRDKMYWQIRSLVPESQVGRIRGIEDPDGNGDEDMKCLHFDEIVRQGKKKQKVCENCTLKDGQECLSRKDRADAWKYRIIVTTHAQYRACYNTWYGQCKWGHPQTLRHGVKRKLFIVDEDIVGSLFFNCPAVKYKDFKDYCNLIEKYESREDKELTSGYGDSLERLKNNIEQAQKSGESAYILPTNPDFSLSKAKDSDEKSSDATKIGILENKTLDEKEINQRLTEHIKSAIKSGCTYSVYRNRNTKKLYNKTIHFNLAEQFPLYIDVSEEGRFAIPSRLWERLKEEFKKKFADNPYSFEDILEDQKIKWLPKELIDSFESKSIEDTVEAERILSNVCYSENYVKPFHVFFDATEVMPEIKEWVLEGREAKPFPVPVAPLGQLTVYQTQKSDLPRGQLKQLTKKVKLYCENVIQDHGSRARYFVVTTGSKKAKTVSEEQSKGTYKGKGYEKLVREIFEGENSKRFRLFEKKDKNGKDRTKQNETDIQNNNHNYCILRHFGDIRGVNEARYCDVGILLGKYKVPDAAEVAWSIPFISKSDPIFRLMEDAKRVLKISEMKTGAKDDERNRPYYKKDDYDSINKIVLWKRNTENEQAIGRPRFLFHNVDFYAVTKDNMKQYRIFQGDPKKDRNLPKLITHARGDLVCAKRVSSFALPTDKAVEEITRILNSFTKKNVVDRLPRICGPLGIKFVAKKEKKYNEVNKFIKCSLNQHYPGQWYMIRKRNDWHYVVKKGNLDLENYLKQTFSGKGRAERIAFVEKKKKNPLRFWYYQIK